MTKVNCIEVRDVSFSYNGTPVLENITFAVEEGEYLGIIGPNGGGKTPLFKIILGLLKPATGEVRIYGEPGTRFGRRHLIGYVPQRAMAEGYFPATREGIGRGGRAAADGGSWGA